MCVSWPALGPRRRVCTPVRVLLMVDFLDVADSFVAILATIDAEVYSCMTAWTTMGTFFSRTSSGFFKILHFVTIRPNDCSILILS